jgi:hypothetical protein
MDEGKAMIQIQLILFTRVPSVLAIALGWYSNVQILFSSMIVLFLV